MLHKLNGAMAETGPLAYLELNASEKMTELNATRGRLW